MIPHKPRLHADQNYSDVITHKCYYLIVYSDWLLLTDRCCYWLLVNQSHDLIDTYHSMIVRIASPVTRGFLSLLLSLLDPLFTAKENLWDQGTMCLHGLIQSIHAICSVQRLLKLLGYYES